MHHIYRLAAIIPGLQVGNPTYNAQQIIGLFEQAKANGASLIATPELALTGYTCGDLFEHEVLLRAAENSLRTVIAATAGSTAILLLGLPWKIGSRLFNTAAVIQNGRLRAVIGKTYLTSYREFYEKRQFRSCREYDGQTVLWDSQPLPFGNDIVLQAGTDFRFALEICEDLWAVQPPSIHHALNGAQIICNLYAGPEQAGKAGTRRRIVQMQSYRLACAYLLSGAGVQESTSDLLFSGHSLIACNGKMLAESCRFQRGNQVIYADVKPSWLEITRRAWTSFNECPYPPARVVDLEGVPEAPDWQYFQLEPHPFIPGQQEDRPARYEEILSIQASALAKRWEHSGARRLVLGLSGGLDSTLALLVCARCSDLLGRERSTICAVTMPGFGTSPRTQANANQLASALGVELRTISITKAVEQHLADIGHDLQDHNVTYENSQARERTQILFDLANDLGGLVIGTGDLSEIALGWNTFNGDHISNYSVNAGIPKTLARALIEYLAAGAEAKLAAILEDILKTPVSPELLPGTQHTEDILGSYELHDFFLYYFFKYGEDPAALRDLAIQAFAGTFSPKEITRVLTVFLRRFFSQQFKRNVMPDGPKVGSVALSPRGDWRMPADASAEVWRLALE